MWFNWLEMESKALKFFSNWSQAYIRRLLNIVFVELIFLFFVFPVWSIFVLNLSSETWDPIIEIVLLLTFYESNKIFFPFSVLIFKEKNVCVYIYIFLFPSFPEYAPLREGSITIRNEELQRVDKSTKFMEKENPTNPINPKNKKFGIPFPLWFKFYCAT